MLSRLSFVLIVYLLIAGCEPKWIPNLTIDTRSDSAYLSDYVTGSSNGDVSCFGYRSKMNDLLIDSFNTEVIHAGIILNAKSILTSLKKIHTVFGNDTDSCSLLYSIIVKQTREGRSAATSISNTVAFFRGKDYTLQKPPDTTLEYITTEGSIMHNDQLSGFYYRCNQYHNLYQGWLVLNRDTLKIRWVKSDYDENGKLLEYRLQYSYWIELVKNEATCAAILLDHSTKRKLFVWRSLSETEKMLINAFLAVVVYHSYIS